MVKKDFGEALTELQDIGHPMLMAPWEQIMEMSEELNLDKEQLKALYDAREKLQEANRPIRTEIDKLRIDMQDIMKGTDAGQLDQALKISGQIHDQQGKIRTNTIKAVFELRKILNAEQQTKIRELFREHREDRMEMKGKGERHNRDGKHGRNPDCGQMEPASE